MGKRKKYACFAALLILALAGVVVFTFADIRYTGDDTADGVIKNCLTELCAAICAVAAGAFIYGKELFCVPKERVKSSLLWCIPCLLCVLANFPYCALIRGTARVERGDLVWIFALYCILIGVFEEILFRGILQRFISSLLTKKKYADFLCVLFTSLAFALWHLFNITGAGVGATLLQVGYSFLIGAMLSSVMLKSGNVYICVALHAIFDFGGMLVTTLGSGNFQDVGFWILTAVFGVLCCGHVLAYLLKNKNK